MAKTGEPTSPLVLDTLRLFQRLGLSGWIEEYPFWPGRKFAIDFYFPVQAVAVEVEGYGHARQNRYYPDVEKYNEIAARGMVLIRVTRGYLDSGHVEWWLRRAFGLAEVPCPPPIKRKRRRKQPCRSTAPAGPVLPASSKARPPPSSGLPASSCEPATTTKRKRSAG